MGLWINYGYNANNILSMGDLQVPIHGGTLVMFGHILLGYSLKFRPEKYALYMVGTSYLGS